MNDVDPLAVADELSEKSLYLPSGLSSLLARGARAIRQLAREHSTATLVSEGSGIVAVCPRCGDARSTKTCTRCKATKPVEAFARDRRRKDGRFPYCRECHREMRTGESDGAGADS